MKLAQVLLAAILCSTVCNIMSANQLILKPPMFNSISMAIFDVIRTMLIEQRLHFDFLVYGESTARMNDVVNELARFTAASQVSVNISYVFKYPKEYYRSKFRQSTVILMRGMHEFEYLCMHAQYFPIKIVQRVKFLIYIDNVDRNMQNISPNYLYNLRFFSLIMFTRSNSVELHALEFYKANSCEQHVSEQLNTFEDNQWTKPLENHEFMRDFQGCAFIQRVELSQSFYFDDYKDIPFVHDPYKHGEMLARYFIEHKNVPFKGALYEITEMAAKRLNFTPLYQLVINMYNGEAMKGKRGMLSIPIDGIVYVGFHVDLAVRPLVGHEYFAKGFFTTLPFSSTDYVFKITPNDLYDNYEKMTFPFDRTTWLLLIATFAVSFCSIFVINRLSLGIKTIVYGRGVNMPAYNAVSIFFGIGQTRLPSENFSRIILILFIWFCLIFRTCFQSRMFEFMTTDMRKPAPETFEDLRDMQYTAVVGNSFDLTNYVVHENFRAGREELKTNIMNFDFEAAYTNASNHKMAFFINTETHRKITYKSGHVLPEMRGERVSVPISITFSQFPFIPIGLQTLIESMAESGIVKHLYDYGLWYLYRPVDAEVVDTRKVLTLEMLEYGFVLWLGACLISFLAFLCEILPGIVRRHIVKLIGLVDLLRALQARLMHYHDRW